MSEGRSQLLDAAAALFADRGYDAVSMRDIANVVGVTQANLYYHFRDKADLIEATLAQAFEARAAELDSWLAGHPDKQLEAYIGWLVQALMTDRIFARLLNRELLDGDDNRIEALSRTVLQGPFNSLVVALDGKDAGSSRMIALSFIGVVLGQVLVLPLRRGLVGQSEGPESVETVTTRVLALVRSAAVEA